MNEISAQDPANPLTSTEPSAPPAAILPEDDFDGEELGERQPETCSLEEGCLSCQ